MTEDEVLTYLNNQIKITKNLFNSLFNGLRDNIVKKSNLNYILGLSNSIELNNLSSDLSIIRRLNYVYNKFTETIENIQKTANEVNPLITNEIRKNIDKGFKNEKEKIQNILIKFDFNNRVTYTSGEVVRRIIENLEFAPLNITFLDPELFSLCYVISNEKDNLNPNEQQVILERIKKEFHEYISEQKIYHDLSTLWWALRLILYDSTITDDKKTKYISEFMTLKPIKYIMAYHQSNSDDKIKEKFITTEGKIKRAFERHRDFVTEFRSLNYCFLNASEIRLWIISKRDPRQLTLTNMIREFEDACCTIGLKWCQISPYVEWLYDSCLKIDFLGRYWERRVSSFNIALKINNSQIRIVNKSPVENYATSNKDFANEIKFVSDAIKKYNHNQNNKRPLVIGLFGNPGSGKSFLANQINKSQSDKHKFVSINLANIFKPEDFFSKLASIYHQTATNKEILTFFFDEFDVKSENNYWFRWLLTLLWDLEIPLERGRVDTLKFKPCVIFLAASRYENFNDFRDFCISPVGKEIKATDLLSRIDIHLDIPKLTAEDRVLIIESSTNNKADNLLKALCYLADLEDGARGIEKLLKGVNFSKKIQLTDLVHSAQQSLLKAAGIINNSIQ